MTGGASYADLSYLAAAEVAAAGAVDYCAAAQARPDGGRVIARVGRPRMRPRIRRPVVHQLRDRGGSRLRRDQPSRWRWLGSQLAGMAAPERTKFRLLDATTRSIVEDTACE